MTLKPALATLLAGTLILLGGCKTEDPKVAQVKRGVSLVARAAANTGCEDRLFDNYPRFVECMTQALGAQLKALAPGTEGSNEMSLLTLKPGHPPLAIEQGGMIDVWPKETTLWLGGPGAPWSVAFHEDEAAHEVVIEGFGEDTAKPIASERVKVGR